MSENLETLATLIKADNEQAIKRWGKICTDVMVLHCIRFVLHNKVKKYLFWKTIHMYHVLPNL